LSAAFHQIKEGKLYRGTHDSFEKYFLERWKYTRSHAYRLADAGSLIQKVKASPQGDIEKYLTSEAHVRPLVALDDPTLATVLAKIDSWKTLVPDQKVTPKVVETAVSVVVPPKVPAQTKAVVGSIAKKFVEIVEAEKKSLPAKTEKPIIALFENLKKKALALGDPPRTTGIDWTEATWNPLSGCTRASRGCDFCYAAKLMATRMASKYPEFAKKTKDGKYAFTGKIALHPEKLAEPLWDKTPKKYFVNSMSDLFHSDVPDSFIDEVFDVMERASWHIFQVLTKRPERMANYTSVRYKNRAPARNVWLGTSTEDQKSFDERYPHLVATKAAVLWLSCEPLLGPIRFKSLAGINWVVVGGESGSTRKMEAAWVRGIRDQCKGGNVPFYLKQWGVFGEDGSKLKKSKKDGLTPMARLDGLIHNAFPSRPDNSETVDGNTDNEGTASKVNQAEEVPLKAA